MNPEQKNYLDTSIVFKIINGSIKYKEYLAKELAGSKMYVIPYVQMEIRRGIICTLVEFYTTLSISESLADANRLWTNRFSKRQLAVVAHFMSDMVEKHPTELSSKEMSLRRLALYIRRIEAFTRTRYKNPGHDSTHCPKPKILLAPKGHDSQSELIILRNFWEALSNKKCREQCKIDDFMSSRFRQQNDNLIEFSKSEVMNGKKSSGRGFLNITQAIEQNLTNGSDSFTCKSCSKIGDAVIALLAPEGMRVVHSDQSFDFLCDVLKKPHKKLLSESHVAKNQ